MENGDQTRSKSRPDTSPLHKLPLELRLLIWKHLLVSTSPITPRYTVCDTCCRHKSDDERRSHHKSDNERLSHLLSDDERRLAQRMSDCIWNPLLSLNIYPNILRTCRLFHMEGIDLLYSWNSFTNSCANADATTAYFFQSIGAENASRVQNYTMKWPYELSSALIYLSALPSLQCLTIENFHTDGRTKANLDWLSRIPDTIIRWDTEQAKEQAKETSSRMAIAKKRRRLLSWEEVVST
ncbi:hypothetical protein DL98DRAFT_522616 [Cadophora sp. DSE1049]|nr:hypothetical protein DL98DRAFT_522616 [Cadophora sp. DSE1049]